MANKYENAGAINLETLFSSNEAYKVPTFQRDFSWPEENVEELSASVDLSKHLRGCPYIQKCKYVTKKNLYDKCKEEMPYISENDSFMIASGTTVQALARAINIQGKLNIITSSLNVAVELLKNKDYDVIQLGGNVRHSSSSVIGHYANFILEFEPRFKKDWILEKPGDKHDPDKNKIIGHFAKITVKKSPNEKTNAVIKYPILYGRKGGKSIWIEKEILDMLFLWDFAHRKGAGWIEFDPELLNIMSEAKIDFPEKIQGEHQFDKFLEESPEAKDHLMNYFKKMVLSV